MVMVELKKIDILSFAKLMTVVYGIIGLIFGIFYAIFSIFSGSTFGFFGIIIFPILYGLGGFVLGLITGFFYNVVAKWIGGMKFDLEEKE